MVGQHRTAVVKCASDGITTAGTFEYRVKMYVMFCSLFCLSGFSGFSDFPIDSSFDLDTSASFSFGLSASSLFSFRFSASSLFSVFDVIMSVQPDGTILWKNVEKISDFCLVYLHYRLCGF